MSDRPSAPTIVELSGTVDEQGRLHVEQPLPLHGPRQVRVWVLIEEEPLSEEAWLHAVAHNPAFADLASPEEDIYTLEDGKPFHDGEV